MLRSSFPHSVLIMTEHRKVQVELNDVLRVYRSNEQATQSARLLRWTGNT